MSARRTLQFLAVGFGISLLAASPLRAADAEAKMISQAERIVSKYKTVMKTPPGKVPSRDVCDGPLLGNGDLGAVISGNPEAQKFWISKNNFWRLKDGHRQGGPRLFGGLEVNIPALAGGTYQIEQQLYPAITVSQFAKGESTVTMRSWVAATDDVLLVELSVAGAPVDVATKLWAAPGRGSKEETGQKDGLAWVTKAFKEDVKIPTEAAAALKILGANEAAFKLEPGKTITLAVAVQSSFDAKEPLAAAMEKAAGVTPEKVQTLNIKHLAWWKDFWAKSLVEIGDPLLEQTYYASNYMMGAGTRDKDFPAGLFSLWVTHDDPRWAGDYHLNFDFQSQYYGLYKSNHIEQADTFNAPILDFMDAGREYAKKILGIRGVYYCVGIGAKGIDTCKMGNRNNAAYQEGGCFMGQKCNAAYSVIPMSMQWYHTYDKDYGKRVYPFVLEVANFWEDYLKFEDGRYVIQNDSIQENSGTDMNSIMSLGLVRNVFETALDMSKELNVDADRRAKWQDILKNLSKFPTFEKDGKTVFRYTEKGTEWINGNSCGIQHIYPSGAIGLDDDPKLLEIARNTLVAAGRPWAADNGENSQYPAAVRVGCDPDMILERLKTLWSTSRKTHNGMPETMEQCSTCPNTINEMLCMSHRQVLRLFPVWPKNKDARFWNLRAEGAFLVSGELKGGAVQFVKIHSEKGRDCTFVNPWPGKGVDVYRDGKKIETLKGDRIVMKTEAGATVVLVTEGSQCPSVE